LRLAITGASGRMGRMLVEAAMAATDCRLVGALDIEGSPCLGRDAAAHAGKVSGVLVSADLDAALSQAQVLIDFTRPEATLAHADACRRLGVAMVIGTTGFTPAQKDHIAEVAAQLPIVMAPNMSIGVNVMLRLLDAAARALSDGYDVEVIETHHRDKVDAPSGTALQMGTVVAKALGRDLDECAVYGRVGTTGPRDARTIGFATVRGGDVIGDHTVLFAGPGERIEISHRSSSRTTYAEGALRAARYVAGRAPGLYGMDDVLGLR
jgi:4-hydroxy-tetrahydrodipicolinate reductase